MSVIGFDIGNESCVIAAAKRGGIDVLLNDESKRETQSVVSFGEKQRFLGSAGAASATANPRSTISQVKRLVGRLYNDPSVQEDLKLLPFVTSEGPRGGILIELEYLKQKMTFTPVEILGMLFRHLKQITEKNLESPVVDCVIGIPSYFTDLQRREYLDAACIAGLRPLRLMHDGTATALGYGMYKTDFSDSGPTYAIFVDIGHCDTQVTIAAFEAGQMTILAHSFDQSLGGRDFDEVLFKHFAALFKEKHKIDVYLSTRACIRLRAACEKVKKVLSANAEAQISIDCLIDDTDVRGIITREEFENLSSGLLERVTVPCSKALKDSGLSVDEISTIELVGSGSRIPAIMKSLTLYFQKEPTRTLNASECVARGCALRCAMLSPTLQVREYKVEDVFPYSIALPLDELENEDHQEFMLFSKGCLFPNDKGMIHTGPASFYFKVSYTNKTDLPAGISPVVGHFQIGSQETAGSGKVKVEFIVKLNDHGIVEINSASILPGKNFYPYPERMVANSRMSNLPFSKNLDIAMTKDELREARERARALEEQDIKVEQIKDQRNTLESFVYDTRSKLLSAYRSFATESEKEVLIKNLQDTEDSLYEDSDDESDQDYTGKLDDLKKLLDPIEKRYKDEKAREQATKALKTCIEKYRLVANSLPPEKKDEVLVQCRGIEQWLNELDPSFDNVLLIKESMETFERICKRIMIPQQSLPKKDQHVDLDQRDQRLNPNQRDQSVHLNQRNQSLNSHQRDQPLNPNQRDQHVHSNQRDQSLNSHQRDQSVNSKQRDQCVNSNQRDQPLNSHQRDQSVNSKQRDQCVNSNQRDQPLNSAQRHQPVKSKLRDLLVDPDQPVDWELADKPVELNQRDDQPVDSNQRDESSDSDKSG